MSRPEKHNIVCIHVFPICLVRSFWGKEFAMSSITISIPLPNNNNITTLFLLNNKYLNSFNLVEESLVKHELMEMR